MFFVSLRGGTLSVTPHQSLVDDSYPFKDLYCDLLAVLKQVFKLHLYTDNHGKITRDLDGNIDRLLSDINHSREALKKCSITLLNIPFSNSIHC